MLSPQFVDQIRRLVAEGRLSQRKIAGLLGVSRGTVSAVAAGRYPERQPKLRDPLEEDPASGPIGRCRECGGLVHLPCRLCRARRRIAQRRFLQRRQGDPRPDEPIRLDLRGEHRRRYERIHARRMRLGELHKSP